MMQNLCFGLVCTISGYRSCVASILIHWPQNNVWEWFRQFHQPFDIKVETLFFRAWMHYFRVPKLRNPFYSIRPKMLFGSDSKHFANLRNVKTSVSGLNALFQGTEVAKHPFYSIRPKMMSGSVSEHLGNLRRVNRCKTSVSGLNALFQGTEAAKHLFYCIRPKMMFESLSEHFANLRHLK
jgi:hypothetical protein